LKQLANALKSSRDLLFSAARHGARTLLLEHMGFLGGAATARNVLTYCGLFTLGETRRQAVRCVAAGVDVFLHSCVSEAEREGDAVTSIIFDDHGGRHGIRARAWVDASGDCDLATFAGASVRYGNGGYVNLGTLGTRYVE
jgi:hypothetical protein